MGRGERGRKWLSVCDPQQKKTNAGESEQGKNERQKKGKNKQSQETDERLNSATVS